MTTIFQSIQQETSKELDHLPKWKRTTALFFVLLVTFLLPFLSHAGGLGMAPAGFILGLVGYVLIGRDLSQYIQSNAADLKWLALLLLFLAWVFLSAFWSPYRPDIWPMNAGKFGIGILGFLGVFFLPGYIQEDGRIFVGHAVMACGFFVAGILAYDYLSGFGLTYLFDPLAQGELLYLKHGSTIMNLGHSMTVLALLSPIVIGLILSNLKNRVEVLCLWLFAIIFAAILSRVSIALLAVILTLPIMALAVRFPIATIRLLFGMIISSFLFAPVLGYAIKFVPLNFKNALPMSWEHRVEMWAYIYDKIQDKFLFGHGFDAARTFDETFSNSRFDDMPFVSLHPHNFPLHIWVETGLVGILLVTGTVFFLMREAEKAAREGGYKAASLAGLIFSVFLISLATYGVWQEWWWVAIAVVFMYFCFVPTRRLL